MMSEASQVPDAAEGALPAVTVRIPAQIRMVYGAQAKVALRAGSVIELIHALDRLYPGMGERLLEPGDVMRRWVNVFVGQADIRDLDGERTLLKEGDEVTIMPSAAGG